MPLTAIELALLMALTLADVQRLEKYEAASAGGGDAQVLAEQARRDFAGRGVEIAQHFLAHNDAQPRNDAYFFVLQAVGDAETAVVLIRALADPPTRESGILDRHFGEIAVAIESVLTNPATGSDPRIAAALGDAIAAARTKPYGAGTHEALAAVRLLGHCRSAEAADVLRQLAADPDSAVRAAATGALGQLGAAEDTLTTNRTSRARDVLQILSTDPDPSTRRQAAESAGFLDTPEVLPALHATLLKESDPRVVDAIVDALRRRGAPVDDPQQCRALMGRAWEIRVAEQMLDCWVQRGVTRDALIQAALDGPATQRAAVLSALASPQPEARSLVRIPRDPPSFDPPIRADLLDSALWVLSQGDDVSSSSRDTAERALWEISGRDMGLSLQYADRIMPRAARFRASSALARADLTAYDTIRRQRQAAIAMLIAVGISLLVLVRSAPRRPLALLAASAAGWAVWSLQASGVRDLPPPPLQLLSVGALAWFSAGLATGGAALAGRRGSSGRVQAAVRVVLALVAAGVIGATLCGVTRNARLFPSDMSGWELILDPLAAMVVAVVAAAILMSVDGIVSRARQLR